MIIHGYISTRHGSMIVISVGGKYQAKLQHGFLLVFSLIFHPCAIDSAWLRGFTDEQWSKLSSPFGSYTQSTVHPAASYYMGYAGKGGGC